MSELELNLARQDVERSTREIDEALHHLEGKVDGTMQGLKRIVNQVKEFATRTKEKMIRSRDTVSHAMHEIQSDGQELYSKAKAGTQRMTERVKSDPIPLYLGAGAVALIGLSILMLRQRADKPDIYERVRPDYLEEHSSLFDEVA